ncbi:hypothetical protein CCUS01_12655 [Colletotrichum cuscutae]|uniref:Uncharacterized protein n=1 Tax=Colletotrichum cuscutae TaxID=1209917 RepID=A0AAI9TTT2_9PEZI|nr:hypothetical protein CCUS01_12655 [Colletotrichum cuscutae]
MLPLSIGNNVFSALFVSNSGGPGRTRPLSGKALEHDSGSLSFSPTIIQISIAGSKSRRNECSSGLGSFFMIPGLLASFCSTGGPFVDGLHNSQINVRFLSRTCFAQYHGPYKDLGPNGRDILDFASRRLDRSKNGLRCAARRLPSAPEPQSNGSYTKIEYFAAGNFVAAFKGCLGPRARLSAFPSTKTSAHITLDIARDAPFTTMNMAEQTDGYITQSSRMSRWRVGCRDPKEWYDGRQKTARWVSKQQVQPDSTRGRINFGMGSSHPAPNVLFLPIGHNGTRLDITDTALEFFFPHVWSRDCNIDGFRTAMVDDVLCPSLSPSFLVMEAEHCFTLKMPDLQAGIYFPIRRFFDDGGCDKRDETIWPATRCITVAKFPASFPTPILNDMYSKGQKEAHGFLLRGRRSIAAAGANHGGRQQTGKAYFCMDLGEDGPMSGLYLYIGEGFMAGLSQFLPGTRRFFGLCLATAEESNRLPAPRLPKSEDLLFDFVWVRSIAAYYLSTVCYGSLGTDTYTICLTTDTQLQKDIGGLSKPNKLLHLTGGGEMIFTVLIRRQPGETWTLEASIKKSSKQQARDAEEGTRSQKEKRDKTKEVWVVDPGSPRFLQRHVARRTSYAAYSFSRIIPSGLVGSGTLDKAQSESPEDSDSRFQIHKHEILVWLRAPFAISVVVVGPAYGPAKEGIDGRIANRSTQSHGNMAFVCTRIMDRSMTLVDIITVDNVEYDGRARPGRAIKGKTLMWAEIEVRNLDAPFKPIGLTVTPNFQNEATPGATKIFLQRLFFFFFSLALPAPTLVDGGGARAHLPWFTGQPHNTSSLPRPFPSWLFFVI